MGTKKLKAIPASKTSEPTIQEANYLVTGLTNVSMRLHNLEAHFQALATNVLKLSEMVTERARPLENEVVARFNPNGPTPSDH